MVALFLISKNKEFFRHQWGRIFLFDKGQSFLPEEEKKENLFFWCEHSANSTDFWSIESLSYSWIKKPRCIFYLKSRQFFFFFGFSCPLCFLRNKVGMHMCLLLIFFLWFFFWVLTPPNNEDAVETLGKGSYKFWKTSLSGATA